MLLPSIGECIYYVGGAVTAVMVPKVFTFVKSKIVSPSQAAVAKYTPVVKADIGPTVDKAVAAVEAEIKKL